MTTTFAAQVAVPQATALDPTKHVNFTLGMVLGVDDLNQDFAYLTGRDQTLARDLLGYGTVSGLQVSIEPDARGPQVVVGAGLAVNPRGQLIRVPLTQCALLNDWLAAHNTDLPARIVATGSPPTSGSPPTNGSPPVAGSPPGPTTGSVQLYVVLGYRSCPTDQVPIPGEPCRTEDQATVASRIADDFDLELRFDAPDQLEEDALRRFVAWLAQVQVADSAAPLVPRDLEQLILGGSPPSSPLSSPPAPLRVRSSDTGEFLRIAFRMWSTVLRPGHPADADADQVLLAQLKIPVVRATVASGSVWQVAPDLSGIERNEQRRPYMVNPRMLQEWLLSGRPGVPAYGVVSAGVVRADGSRRATVLNGLTAQTIADGQLLVRFDTIRASDPSVRYIVNATPVYGPVGGLVAGARAPIVTFDHLDAGQGGLVLFVTDGSAAIPRATLTQLEFMVEIGQF